MHLEGIITFISSTLMEFAAISCSVKFLHRVSKLVVYIDKLQIRQKALENISALRNTSISLHVTLLPENQRRKTKRQFMRDLYYVYNQELDMGLVKATEVGDMGLRMRAYAKSSRNCGGEYRIADAMLLLRGLSLTSQYSEHTVILTDELNDYNTILYVRQINEERNSVSSAKEKRPRRNHATVRGVNKIRKNLKKIPEIAIHLNYETHRRVMVVHIESAKNLDVYDHRLLKIEVLVLVSSMTVLYRSQSEGFISKEFEILHQAFEIPLQPSLCREVTVVVQIIAPISKSKRQSGKFSSPWYPLGHVRFGRRCSGNSERRLYLEMFEDEFPTERKWFPLLPSGLSVL